MLISELSLDHPTSYRERTMVVAYIDAVLNASLW